MKLSKAKRSFMGVLTILFFGTLNSWAHECRIEKYFSPQPGQEEELRMLLNKERAFGHACTESPKCEINLAELKTTNTMEKSDAVECNRQAEKACVLNKDNQNVMKVLKSKIVNASYDGKMTKSYNCTKAGLTELPLPTAGSKSNTQKQTGSP
jgi:hypothetical protein